MKGETAAYLERARAILAEARAVAEIGVSRVAGREAYLAAFHAAEAYIFERSGKTSKTHRGVRALFNELARDDAGIPPECAEFLSDGFDLKSVADYGTGLITPTISPDDAAEALEKAERMIRTIAECLA